MNGVSGLARLESCSKLASVERALRRLGLETGIQSEGTDLPIPEDGAVEVCADACGHVLVAWPREGGK